MYAVSRVHSKGLRCLFDCTIAWIRPSFQANTAPKPNRQPNPTSGYSGDYLRRVSGDGVRNQRLFPRFFTQQHDPTAHQEFSRHCNNGFLLASLLPASKSVVDRLGPGIVTEHQPGRFDQCTAQLSRSAFVNAALPIHLAGLIASRYEACV